MLHGLGSMVAARALQDYMIVEGRIDSTFVIRRAVPLEDGPLMFETFRDKKDGCVKALMKP